jgi:hypothetical protein
VTQDVTTWKNYLKNNPITITYKSIRRIRTPILENGWFHTSNNYYYIYSNNLINYSL